MSTIKNIGKIALQRFYSPHRFLWRLPADQPKVALTFDDGPDPLHTAALLDLLAAADIKATFFLIGKKALQHPQLVRRMVAEGHAIGGHSFEHREIVDLTPEELAMDLEWCRKIMREACGVDSILFRPPRGKVNRSSIHQVCQLGYCLVHWSRTYSDYRQDGVAALTSRMRMHPPCPRDIILMHDHNAGTHDALATLIPHWRRCGLTFTALAGGRS